MAIQEDCVLGVGVFLSKLSCGANLTSGNFLSHSVSLYRYIDICPELLKSGNLFDSIVHIFQVCSVKKACRTFKL